jgi:alanine racemase
LTFLEIDLKKLEFNYHSIRKRLKSHTKIIGVIKANAYGSASGAIAEKLISLGVEALAVAYASEGIELRQLGIKAPILVFYPQVDCFKEIIDHNLEPVLYSKRSWEKWVAESRKTKKSILPIHIKYNTGLNRIGFQPDEVHWVLEQLKNSTFEVKSVYTHLGQTEYPKPDSVTSNQISLFELIIEKHKAHSSRSVAYHLLNTSGLFNYPEHQMDWVRIGIGFYGYANRAEWNQSLKPIVTLKTHITQIHELKSGDTVGYNSGWRASKNTRIAVLPLGHADGFSRQYGQGKGWVLIDGQKAPVVGNVCMDMVMVEIGDIACIEGSEVMILGEGIRADALAEASGTISYELLTALGKRIPRVIKQ